MSALPVYADKLYAGGNFLTAGGTSTACAATWTKWTAACPVALTGDANNSGTVVSSDIIYLVNFVLKAGAVPLPCTAAGDVNCDGEVKSSDIIYLVNYVLKAGSPPCDVCTLIPATWSCP